MQEIQSAIASLGMLRTIGAALVAERDRQKAAAIEIQYTDQILELQASLLNVFGAANQQAEALRTATERVRELEAEQRERKRYELVEPVAGFFAQRLRSATELSERANEPVHMLCQACFDGGRKAVLRTVHDLHGHKMLQCPLDGSHTVRVGAEFAFV